MGKVVIIGGGIVGLCSAYYLHQSGWEVTLLDKGDMTDSCSYGNAGMIVPSHFVPLAAPGVIKQGIKWLANAKGPLQIRPSLSLDWLRWGIKFMSYANEKNVRCAAVPLRDISLLSKSLLEKMDAHLDLGVGHKGIMMLSKTEHSAEEEYKQAEEATRLGLYVAILSKEETVALQGGLKMNIVGAVHYRCDAHLQPGILMKKLIQYLKEVGVRIVHNFEVEKIHKVGNKVVSVHAKNGNEFRADAFVLAAGAWSGKVAKYVGLNIPLMPGKGYSFNVECPEEPIKIPALLCEARVAVTPMATKIRFGGTMELGKMGSPVNLKRVQGIVESVNDYFPGLQLTMPSPSSIWHGYRPCSVDGLPYIGFSNKATNMVLATGHGMMGVSLGPATGLLVSELLSGKNTSIDAAPFSPNRLI